MALGSVCHIEFPVTDFDRSQRFYEGMFGWSFREFGPMRVFGSGEDHIGGFMKVEHPVPMSFTQLWIQVDDVEAVLARSESCGGKVLSAKKPVPSVGWSAEVADPDGNPVGIVQFESVTG
jgi:predicted enzyme related to lactoylglutathione lyase